MKVTWKGMAKPDDPIYKTGLTVSAARSRPSKRSPTNTGGTKPPLPASTTTGQKNLAAKGSGLAFDTEGGAYSKENSTAVSFGYFRTKDGKPPNAPKKK